ncbi:hypothetical protein CRUP_007793 [Coryphaenoides rupestris]|nr:hypothetical protein CRUP_007793 [Coryphaenoides rupestris]
MGALTGGELCVKYLLFIFNFVFWTMPHKTVAQQNTSVRRLKALAGDRSAGGGGGGAFGGCRFDPGPRACSRGQTPRRVFFTGVYILIAAGALMMVVGFLGCCGAIKESPCMLGLVKMTLNCLLLLSFLLIFAIEVAAGIWGLSNKNRVVEDVTEFYKQTYANYKNTKQEALKETLRLIHFGLDCCGPTGTVIDAAKDICPKKEGLEVLITTIFGMIFSMLLCCAIKKSRDFV